MAGHRLSLAIDGRENQLRNRLITFETPGHGQAGGNGNGHERVRADPVAAGSVAIVGLGYVGLPTAVELHGKSPRIIGIDVSEQRLRDISARGADLTEADQERLAAALADGSLELTSDPAAAAAAETVIICVPTPVDTNQTPDLAALRAACAAVVQYAVPGQMIILTSTSYVGTTRDLLTEPLLQRGLTAGTDINVAFSPERIDPGNADHLQSETPRVVGGATEACTSRAAEVIGRLTDSVYLVSSPDAAEATKLYENIFRAVSLALANEFADACGTLGLDPIEVTLAAGTKPYGFLGVFPGPGVGGHCIPCDPHYLLWQLNARDHASPLIEQAMKSIQLRPERVVERAAEVLTAAGRHAGRRAGHRDRGQLQGRRARPARVPGRAHHRRADPGGRRGLLLRPADPGARPARRTAAAQRGGPAGAGLRPGPGAHAAPRTGLLLGAGLPAGPGRHLPVLWRGPPRRGVRTAAMITDLRAADWSTPAVVLKFDQNMLHHGSLGVIRSLGRLGVPVYGVHEGAWAPAASSRYLTGRFFWQPRPDDPQRTLSGLFDLASQIGRRAVLYATDDAGAIFLAEHGDVLREAFAFPRPPADLPRRLAGKYSMFQLCRDLGVPTPQAMLAWSPGEAASFAARAGFPLIAKLTTPWRGTAGQQLRSTTIVATPSELQEIWACADETSTGLMLQEYIPPAPGQDWFFHGYFDSASRCQTAFTGVKDRSYPAYAGLTSLGRAVPNSRLREQVTGMAAAIGFRGIVNLDLRFDPRDAQYKLLDFNPRLGAQFRLFTTGTGVNVARAAYLDLTGQPAEAGEMTPGRRFLVENYDPLGAIGYWRRGELGPRSWAGVAAPGGRGRLAGPR